MFRKEVVTSYNLQREDKDQAFKIGKWPKHDIFKVFGGPTYSDRAFRDNFNGRLLHFERWLEKKVSSYVTVPHKRSHLLQFEVFEIST